MALVTGFTAARMLAIEEASVVSGLVDVNGDLILYTKVGTPIDAGNVIGPPGPVNWDVIPDKPATFPPSVHDHDASTLTSGTLADARLPTVSQAANINALSGRVTVNEGDIALLNSLPDPLIDVTSTTSTITSAAGAWQSVAGSSIMSFGNLPRPLWVSIYCKAEVYASSGYTMMGVALSGAVSMTPEQNEPGGPALFAYAPFHESAITTAISVIRVVEIPAGTTNMRFQQRRSAGSGSQGLNYGLAHVTPIKWG